MQYLLTDDLDQLATKEDWEIVQSEFRAECEKLHACLESAFRKQIRALVAMTVGFILTTWGYLIVFVVA